MGCWKEELEKGEIGQFFFVREKEKKKGGWENVRKKERERETIYRKGEHKGVRETKKIFNHL